MTLSLGLEALDVRAILAAHVAYPRVVKFARTFGSAHAELAMYAAIPLGLTPELVHLIRVNFVRRAHGDVLIVRFPGTSFFTTLRQKLGWGGLADRDRTA